MKTRYRYLVLFATLLVASPARAVDSDDGRARAAALFKQAKSAFERHDYAAAAAAFEQAGVFEPHPAAWLNAADAWELNGDESAAATDCDRALAMPTIDERYRAEAEKRLVRLGAKIGTIAFKGDTAFSVRVDGTHEFAVPGKARLVPGRHVVAITDRRTGERRTEELDLAPGQSKAMTLVSSPPASAALEVPSPAVSAKAALLPEYRTTWAPPTPTWVMFGVAAGAAAAGVGFGVATLTARDDYVESPTADHRDAFFTNRTLSTAGWIASGVAVVGGASYWLLTGPRRVRIEGGASPQGAMIEGSVRF